MKRLICSAAVASALLAVTAVPSGAVSVFDTVVPGAFDLTYTFTTTGSPLVISNGSEYNIGPFDFKITEGGAPVFDVSNTAPPMSMSFCGGAGCSESFGPGTFLLTVTGTAGTGFGNFGANFSAPGLTSSITQTPIPGSLVLFLSGFGLLGFWGWTKGRRGGLGSASLEATAC
jgi:hypothetical protein